MTATFRYACYNMALASELALPELLPQEDADAPAELSITLGAVSPDGLAGGKQRGPFLWATPTALQLHIRGVARFLIENGTTITIDPAPGIDEDSLRVFLLGSALGAALFQKGYLVLHGNAVRIGDGCVICVGHSGAGKSTLAAGFLQRGFDLLADDVVPVGPDCLAIPGFPRIKLWKDAAAKLNIDTDGLNRIRPSMEKFNLPVAPSRPVSPLPISHIYVLREEGYDEIEAEPVRGLRKFPLLNEHTYRQKFLDSLALRPDHLKLCGKLANQTPITRLSRPRNRFDVNSLIDRILSDVSEDA